MRSSFQFLLIALIVLFFALRLPFLSSLPPFTDETAYLFWTHESLKEKNFARPMQDGTGPIFMVLTTPFVFLTNHYLLAGRLVSLLAEMGSLLLIGIIVRLLQRNRREVLLTMFFFALSPLALVHGRLALLDPLSSLWALFAILTVIQISLKHHGSCTRDSLILAFYLTLGFLTKPLILAFVPLLFLLPLLLLRTTGSRHHLHKVYRAIFLGLLLSVFLCMLAFWPFREAFLYHYQNYHKNSSDSVPVALTLSVASFRRELSWLYTYFTPPVIVSTLVSITFLLYKKGKPNTLSLIWSSLLLVVIAFFGTSNIFPRYLLYIVPPLSFFLAALVICLGKKNYFGGIFLGLVITLSFILFDLSILRSFPTAKLPKEDIYQFFVDWTSGYGLSETAIFIKEFTSRERTHLVIDDKWFAYALQLFYDVDIDIRIREDLYLKPENSSLDNEKTSSENTLLILNRLDTVPYSWPLKRVYEYDHPPRKPITVYRILPTTKVL